MIFDLSNILVNFEKNIKQMLAKNLDIFVVMFLDNILIYTKNANQGHVTAIQMVFDILRKYDIFANLKKCYFPKHEIHFLNYIILVLNIRIEEKQIEPVKNWPESKLI